MNLMCYLKIIFKGAWMMILIGGSAQANGLQEGDLITEKVVMLVREGAHSGTANDELRRYSEREWPTIGRADGDLTGHGRDALTLWGQYHRERLVSKNLIPAVEAPSVGRIAVFASPMASAQHSAQAFIQGLVSHSFQPVDLADTRAWFFPPRDGLLIDEYPQAVDEAERAFAHMTANINRITPDQLSALEHFFHIPSGHLSLMRWNVVGEYAGMTLRPLRLLDQMAETVRMQYVNNLPLHDVGFGQIENQEAVAQLLRPRSLHFHALREPRFLATRHSAPLLERMHRSLVRESDETVAVYMGHDVNVATVRAALGFHWQTPEGLRNDVGPNGTLIFERLRRMASTERFVRITYQAPTMDQIRQLQTFDRTTRPFTATFEPAPVDGASHAALIPLQRFNNMMAAVFRDAGRGSASESVAPTPDATPCALPSVRADFAAPSASNRTALSADPIDCVVERRGLAKMDSLISPF